VAFCRLSGLAGLFPHSKLFAAYYLGHLNEHENNPATVLSGACMLVKKEALDKTGGFDEQFFMYAEDIDLSYRIQQAGYINYYLADGTIIHFKGESTKKDFRYVKLFYKAMSQFMRKHTRDRGSIVFIWLMELAIQLRGALVAAGLLFRNKAGNTKPKQIKTILKGNKETIDLFKIMALPERTMVQNPAEANEIIFCEGAHFPFKEIIDLMQQDHPSISFKIHACNSHSIVGSDSKYETGEVIVL
jgi:hypothetical protein